VWIPKSAAEIEAAATSGELKETATFDAKEALPAPRRNADIATDVAAMATDGGVLLYGVAEDREGRPTMPRPIPLARARERVDQVVQTSIAEAPYIDVHEYPTDTDPAVGYLLVVVPQSSRAPHQVTVGGDLRFYGRGATGNRRLTEGEIARLYRRREEWEQDRGALLSEAIAAAPFPAAPGLAFLHGFARPVAPDPTTFERASEHAGGRERLQQVLTAVAAQRRTAQDYAPGLHLGPRWHRIGSDSWRLSTQHEPDPESELARYLVNLTVNIDGRGHLFCGRAAELRESRRPGSGWKGPLIIFEPIIAGNLAAFFAFMGTLYRLAGYYGHVDIGFAVVGLQGGHSATIPEHGFHDRPYNASTYPRTARIAATELNEPETVVRTMLRHLMEATTGRQDFDPFGAGAR